MKVFTIDEESFTVLQQEMAQIRTALYDVNRKLTEHDPNKLFNTKSLMEYLQVGEKCIRRYRDEGLLRFHKAEDSDKIWYLQKDVDDFLAAITVPAYRIDGLDLPVQLSK